MPITGREVI